MPDRAISLAVNGAFGRMGARIIALAETDARFTIGAAIDPSTGGSAAIPGAHCRCCDDVTAPIDVIIDFSGDSGCRDAIALARRGGAALLVGTTGLASETRSALEALTLERAVLVAPNTSLGVAVLRALCGEAARLLQGFDIDVIESHHAGKKDAPSGTALALAASIRAAGGRLPEKRVHAIRAGEIIGEHTIQFAGAGEVIALSHRAVSRDLFARGALVAAAWLAGRPPGAYAMEDVLGRGGAAKQRRDEGVA